MAFGGAYAISPYLLFFHQGKKRRQKKIKASTEAREVDRVRVGAEKWIEGLGFYLKWISQLEVAAG